MATGHSYSAGVRRRALAIVHSLVRTVSDTLGDDPRAAGALAPLLQPWWPALQAALREPLGVHVREAPLYTAHVAHAPQVVVTLLGFAAVGALCRVLLHKKPESGA